MIGGNKRAIDFYKALGFEFVYETPDFNELTREYFSIVRLRRYLGSESEKNSILERRYVPEQMSGKTGEIR